MGCEARWTSSARDDVERAVRYVALTLDGPRAAASLLDAFEATVDELATSPEACPVGGHPELASRGLRKKLVRRYVMLYSYDGEGVVISRVFHSLQDYARIMGE